MCYGIQDKCALERKIPIMKPSWINESYQIWLRGDDVNVPKVQCTRTSATHILWSFVCLSGITDLERRSRISQVVKEHDGEYLRNLERPVRVTHLLCSGDEETDKMRYAEKFNTRGEATIHLVWRNGFGILSISEVDSTKPRIKFGGHVLKGNSSWPPSSDLPSQCDEIPSSSAAPQNPPKLLQKDTDDGDDEQAFVNVLPAVTLQLWGNLLQRRGYEIADGEVILSPSKGKAAGKGKDGLGEISLNPWKDANSSRHLPFRRTSTPMQSLQLIAKQDLPSSHRMLLIWFLPKQIFAGMKMRAFGEAKSPTVRQAVDQHGGSMSLTQMKTSTTLLGSKLFREERRDLRAKYRTECWLEQCIFQDRICDPEEHITFRPLSIQVPIPGTENSISPYLDFDHAQTLGLKRLFRALGAKFDKAREWGVPVISVAAPVALGAAQDAMDVDAAGDVNVAKRDLKGKGKAVDKGKQRAVEDAMDVEVSNMMNDITKEPQESMSFGAPNGLLGGESTFIHPSSLVTPGASVRSLPVQGPRQPSESFIKENEQNNNSLRHRQSTVLIEPDAEDTGSGVSKQQQHSYHQHDRDRRDRVPSSMSPSPMKMPMQRTNSRGSLSPVKINHEAAKALQEKLRHC
ncbi:hypothetical protein CPB84DRAFT_1746116 [Gymnopilus junonius]|uniref:BRCT domain-containing protein n=1 Tax=Gymnopilus junonius TaxID=109634 RepID=A0A9P5TQJ8_GYMJU|nr:hypothetical protein CPB84DRAFT_1746116 [Gymnopilus junonius]